MSWNHTQPEIDADRQWREAITLLALQVGNLIEPAIPATRQLERAWRHLALQREWIEDTGGES